MNYLDKIEQIKRRCEFIAIMPGPVKWEYREYGKIDIPIGFMYIRLHKHHDDDYYNYAQWQIWRNDRYVDPILWDIGDIDKLYKIITMPQLEYAVYSRRVYGQPKLAKPSELKGVKPIGSATFIPKRCSPQVFVKDGDVWIKHTDFFSEMWRPPLDDIGKSQDYYLNKYFNQHRTKKFTYSDNWGAIVLRNEAWLCIKNMVGAMEYMSEREVARELCRQMGLEEPWRDWEDFYVNVYRLVKEILWQN